MESSIIKLFLVVLIFNLASCKEETTFTDYKFTDQAAVITCTNPDSKLLNEALFSFENDIVNHYDKKNLSKTRAYSSFIRASITNRVPFKELVSEHTVNILNALKEAAIFKNNNLDYNAALTSCLTENMTDGALKSTINALTSTNSMSKKLFKPALSSEANAITKDKNLGMYVALDFFYAEMLKIDFSTVDFDKKEADKIEPTKPNNSKVDFNKRPVKQVK